MNNNQNKDNDKLDMQSPNLVNQNIEKLAELFPNCVTESANGKAIDFDLLKQELNHAVVEGNKERYRLEWPGKREAIVTANLPTTKTLRPVREDSVDFDNTENLYIEGDNLEVLKLLQESYLGKIKMIYIDPPYNTGKDFVYVDNFTQEIDEYKEDTGQVDELNQRLVKNVDTSGRYHSRWMSMIYPRLKLARNLLKDDGAIFVSIDHHEIENLKKIMDEIFGEKNHIGTLSIINNMKGRNDKKNIATCHEYLCIYGKGNFNSNGIPLNEEQLAEFKYQDADGYKYALRDLRKRGRPDRREDRPNMYFPIFFNRSNNGCYLTRQSNEDVEITPLRGDGSDGRWRWGLNTVKENLSILHPKYSKQKDKWSIEHRVYLDKPNVDLEDQEDDDDDQVFTRTSKSKSFWWGGEMSTDVANREFKKLFKGLNPDYPKSPWFIEKIIHMGTIKEDIVLDFFGGYSTTAQAVMQLNVSNKKLKFILVQVQQETPEDSDLKKNGFKNICEIGKERIRRAAKKIKEETGADIDYGFRVYRLDESNMQDVYYHPHELDQSKMDLFGDNVKPDRTEDDLLGQVMLAWGLPLSLKIEQDSVAGKKVFKVAENSLFACFDRDIDEAFAKEIAKEKPLRIVFKDAGFKDDTAKTNVKQLLKQLSPETEMKVL